MAVPRATPDHSHAMISLAVLAKRKHLYCEKPLCRTVYETRVVTETARKAGVATQLGNVALRRGKKLDFDWRNRKVTNVPEASQFLKPNYREGQSI